MKTNPHVEEEMTRYVEHFASQSLAEVGQYLRHLRVRFAAVREVYAAKTRDRDPHVTNALLAAGGPPLSPVEDPQFIDEVRQQALAEEIFARVHPEQAKAREIHRRVHGMSVADYKRKRANEREKERADQDAEAKAKRKKSDEERAEIRKAHGPNFTEPARWQNLDVSGTYVDNDGNIRSLDGRLLQQGSAGAAQ